ncbi:MAG: hypothetical protein KatS3mg055_1696 [Chloroflexus sp.]|nr:MAG: hypothetical protein KatS3mg055_1696 [Chloroflexus sp.]
MKRCSIENGTHQQRRLRALPVPLEREFSRRCRPNDQQTPRTSLSAPFPVFSEDTCLELPPTSQADFSRCCAAERSGSAC